MRVYVGKEVKVFALDFGKGFECVFWFEKKRIRNRQTQGCTPTDARDYRMSR